MKINYKRYICGIAAIALILTICLIVLWNNEDDKTEFPSDQSNSEQAGSAEGETELNPSDSKPGITVEDESSQSDSGAQEDAVGGITEGNNANSGNNVNSGDGGDDDGYTPGYH